MSDLDDFFAKKDKTKRNKKKGVSNDDFEKKFEVSERKISERSRDKKFAANLEGFIQDEGEWNDFEEENKDYSGLKIQALSMKDKEEEQREEEDLIKKEQVGVPWKVSDEKEEKKESEPKKESQSRELDSIFLSLALRRGPRINDTVEFPDLGTSSEAYEELKGFQTVRTSTVNKANSSGQNESITTDNKYSALRNNLN